MVLDAEDLVEELRKLGDPKAVDGMSRFGIRGATMFGVSIPNIRALAAKAGKSHGLAQELWKKGIHETRLLAGMIDKSDRVTKKQMEDWAKDFDSWDVVDQTCSNLFDKTPYAISKALEWTKREAEYEKRAGFSLIATLAVHDKTSSDKTFLSFLPSIIRESRDERNFVKKAVNWSLRQIGKRNLALNRAAIETATKIAELDSKSARWIAVDALRELKSDAVQKKLRVQERTERRPNRRNQ